MGDTPHVWILVALHSQTSLHIFLAINHSQLSAQPVSTKDLDRAISSTGRNDLDFSQSPSSRTLEALTEPPRNFPPCSGNYWVKTRLYSSTMPLPLPPPQRHE